LFREDFSFTAFATISYLKIGPKAGLLRNEAHIITIQGTTNKKSIHRVFISVLYIELILRGWHLLKLL